MSWDTDNIYVVKGDVINLEYNQRMFTYFEEIIRDLEHKIDRDLRKAQADYFHPLELKKNAIWSFFWVNFTSDIMRDIKYYKAARTHFQCLVKNVDGNKINVVPLGNDVSGDLLTYMYDYPITLDMFNKEFMIMGASNFVRKSKDQYNRDIDEQIKSLQAKKIPIEENKPSMDSCSY